MCVRKARVFPNSIFRRFQIWMEDLDSLTLTALEIFISEILNLFCELKRGGEPFLTQVRI